MAVEPVTPMQDNEMVSTDTCPSNVSDTGPRHPAMGALMSQILDQTTDGMLVSDDDGVIIYANKPLHELFGYDTGTLIGQPVEVLLPDSVRDQHGHLVAEFMRSARSSRPMGREDLDFEGRRADGSCFSIDVQLNALPGTTLVVVTVRDMTDERKAAVDIAIAKIDLANAKAQNDSLRDSLDLVIQRLFALGTSVVAGTAKDSATDERLTAAVHGIDEVIATVQTTRRATRP
jgi:PAS domain S-box-containing protein